MENAVNEANRRILVIDDMASIRADFGKILGAPSASGLAELERSLFGGPAAGPAPPRFELGFAAQGTEGLAEARRALEQGAPYAMAFVDVRMPPGLDGIETVIELWKLDPRLEIALCTAYSDYTWQQMLERLGRPGQFLVLGKPFEPTGVRQAALALTEKWNVARLAERSREELNRLVRERTEELQRSNARLRAEMDQRVELERRLQYAQKLEALGRLVAGVAHEINNPLSYMLANLETMQAELQVLEGHWGQAARSLRELVTDVATGATRIHQIVRDLTSFGRRDQSLDEDVRVEEVLRFSLRVAEALLPSGCRVEERYQPAPPVRGSAGLLSQVFVNLLANAGRALDGVPKERHLLRVQLEVEAGERVRVKLRDHGVGIPEEQLASIFEPFFTTQPQGQGTGLGLYICNGILQRMGGEIRVESREGEGTEVLVVLPVRAPPQAVERPPTVGVLGTDEA